MMYRNDRNRNRPTPMTTETENSSFCHGRSYESSLTAGTASEDAPAYYDQYLSSQIGDPTRAPLPRITPASAKHPRTPSEYDGSIGGNQSPHHPRSDSVAVHSRSADRPPSGLTDPVVKKLEKFIAESFLIPLADNDGQEPSVPSIESEQRTLHFYNLHQCRNYTNILLVACFCHRLLSARRTATTREVYYYYVTHFFHQRECETAIWDLTVLLGLPSRHALGLTASPRGWYCGSIILYDGQSGDVILNGQELDVHGASITPATYGYSENFALLEPGKSGRDVKNCNASRFYVQSDAKCIFVVEKEGVYTRLSEDKIFRTVPCILVTGKGFPDVATRQWVHRLQQLLRIPAFGLCDCNPYGVSVLNSYQYEHGARMEKAKRKATSGDASVATQTEPQLQLHWIGLRPSQIEELDLPKSSFQELSRLDKTRLESLLDETHPFGQTGWNPEQRRLELEAMKEFKVELEALHWLGMDFLSKYVVSVFREHTEAASAQNHGEESPNYII